MQNRILSLGLSLAVTVLCFGCASDYGVTSSNQAEWLKTYASNPLTDGGLSFRVKNYLIRENYLDEYRNQPMALLKKLDSEFKKSGDYLTLFVLIELTYDQGEKTTKLDALSYYLSSTIYAATYLKTAKPNQYSACFIVACRYYNYASAEIIKLIEQEKIPLKSRWDLPIIQGKVVVNPAKSTLPLPLEKYTSFRSCFDFLQFGFQNYSRSSGLGVPLIAIQNKNNDITQDYTKKGKQVFDLAGIPYPATLFIRIKPLNESKTCYSATPEFFDPYLTDTLAINGEKATLEIDLTTPLAYMGNSGASYSGFMALKNSLNMKIPEGLYLLTPYKKDKIPVVLVHGLMSSPRTWMQMVNTLLSNKTIREKYQFWLFAYPTGLPILYSAYKLRNALLETQRKFDPKHQSQYFNRMIIISHSMGGLLAKTMVLNSDNKLLDSVFNTPINELNISKKQQEFLKAVLCFKALPFVSEVVFMSTPHLGSEMTEETIMRIAASFITLPDKFVNKIEAIKRNIMIKTGLRDSEISLPAMTGVDSLDPKNITLKIMSNMTLQAKFHSIIGDQDKAGKIGGTDGVVRYRSSHIYGAASELVIKSGHDTQMTAEGIKEVRRILLEHLNLKIR